MWMPKNNRTKISLSLSFHNSLLAGQDFFFSTTEQGHNLESLITNMEEYHEGFDADSEAYLWLNSNEHDKNTASTE